MTDLDAFDVGTGFALTGWLLDDERKQLVEELATVLERQPPAPPQPEPDPVAINAAEGSAPPLQGWDLFFGQGQLKEQLHVHISAAEKEGRALEHVLLAGPPGMGKTALARLIAQEMEVELWMLVPPFRPETLFEAAESLGDRDILFIDEIHILARSGPRAAENLLHLLEERRLYLDDGVHELADITIIGASTDADLLPEPVVDRFPIRPRFEPYSVEDLTLIASYFGGLHGVSRERDFDGVFPIYHGIAQACRGVPRVAREMILALRDLTLARSRLPSLEELLTFKQTDADGTTAQHKAYLIALYRHFNRGPGEYVAGEESIRTMLHETRDGLHRIERFLLQAGLIDRTPQGRKLTREGIARARRYDQEAT